MSPLWKLLFEMVEDRRLEFDIAGYIISKNTVLNLYEYPASSVARRGKALGSLAEKDGHLYGNIFWSNLNMRHPLQSDKESFRKPLGSPDLLQTVDRYLAFLSEHTVFRNVDR